MTRFVMTASMAVVAILCGLAACLGSFGDSPLGAVGDQRVVAPGDMITGQVVNPDGDIRVTLAAAGTDPPRHGKSSPARACAYGSSSYACATDALPEGTYRVEVRDATWPSEGVHFVDVVVTSVEGYDPSMVVNDDETSVTLTGWAPGRPVTLTVIDAKLAEVIAGPVTGIPGDDGTVVLRIGRVPSGTFAFEATDGLWSSGDDDNGWGPLFLDV